MGEEGEAHRHREEVEAVPGERCLMAKEVVGERSTRATAAEVARWMLAKAVVR